MNNDNSAETILLQENPRGAERAVGAVCALVGALLALFTWTLVHGPFFNKPSGGIYILVGVSAALTCLFFVAGIRLFLGKRNRYGSLFAPWVWFAISGTMLFAAAVFAVSSVSAPTFAAAQSIAAALLLALLAYGAGCHFRGKARREHGAA
jgi:drug/metabolite transporter (DMT)-like permease